MRAQVEADIVSLAHVVAEQDNLIMTRLIKGDETSDLERIAEENRITLAQMRALQQTLAQARATSPVRERRR